MQHFFKGLRYLFFFSNTPDTLGEYGEYLTESKLRDLKLFGMPGKILQNVYLPKEDGSTSEIDLLYLTAKGIFVIESKNYSGWIFGKEEDHQWTSSLPGNQKFRFYNPIRQNAKHIENLHRFLNNDTLPCFSLIVFSERCRLKKIIIHSTDVSIIKRNHLYAACKAIWKQNPDMLSESELQKLYKMLEPLTHASSDEKKQHVGNIRRQLMTCPRCGAALVLRTAKKGANAGKQFYGCSGFPKCKYTRNL